MFVCNPPDESTDGSGPDLTKDTRRTERAPENATSEWAQGSPIGASRARGLMTGRSRGGKGAYVNYMVVVHAGELPRELVIV